MKQRYNGYDFSLDWAFTSLGFKVPLKVTVATSGDFRYRTKEILNLRQPLGGE